jgi:hypothetical protein
MCLLATNTAQIEIEWEGISYTVSIAPHDMTDNRISLEKGYLLNLEVLGFPIEFWRKELIAAAFYPFGSVIVIDQQCLTGTDFVALSICLNLHEPWLPRKVMLKSGGRHYL